jgi:hypothetical protein
MRVKFPSGQQRAFIEEVLRLTNAPATSLASRIGVCGRTFQDWKREKWQIDDRSLNRLCRLANLAIPDVTLLPEHWSVPKASRLGGRRRIELYGSPGTPEGRARGGRNAQERFRANPEHFRQLGVAVRKVIAQPPLSADLAEWIGIVLGDGGITHCQVTISFHLTLDAAYAEHVAQLAARLFGLMPGRGIDSADHTLSLVFSSVELVETLERLGLKRGNKVQQQVDLPGWVWERQEYQTACLRGLMDTDGCVYYHRYAVNGKMYGYCKLCFTSYSRPLLYSAKRLFESLQMFPTIHAYDGHRLYLHNSGAVKRYFEIVGTHNPRYLERFEQFSKARGEVAEHGRLQLTANELGGQKPPPGFESQPLRSFGR